MYRKRLFIQGWPRDKVRFALDALKRPYSTRKCVRVGYPMLKQRDKQRKPNPCVPNATYIPLAFHVGACVRHHRHALGVFGRVGHYWLVLGGRVGSAMVFRYHHVGIPNAKFSRWRSIPTRGPDALQWNIGFNISHNVKGIKTYDTHKITVCYTYS